MGGFARGTGPRSILSARRSDENCPRTPRTNGHADQESDRVEAEAEVLHRLDRDAGLVGLVLAPAGIGGELRFLRPDQVVQHREQAADGEAQEREDKNGEVGLEHEVV